MSGRRPGDWPKRSVSRKTNYIFLFSQDRHHGAGLGSPALATYIRLKEHGYNAQGINAQAFIAGLMPLATIERFLASARSQVNVLLREINVRRVFAPRAREAFEKRLAAETTEQAETTDEVKQIAAE